MDRNQISHAPDKPQIAPENPRIAPDDAILKALSAMPVEVLDTPAACVQAGERRKETA